MRKIKKVLTPDEFDTLAKLKHLQIEWDGVGLQDLYCSESPKYELAMSNLEQAEELMEDLADDMGIPYPHVDEVPMYNDSDTDTLNMTEDQICDENSEAIDEINKLFGVFFDYVVDMYGTLIYQAVNKNYDDYIWYVNKELAN